MSPISAGRLLSLFPERSSRSRLERRDMSAGIRWHGRGGGCRKIHTYAVCTYYVCVCMFDRERQFKYYKFTCLVAFIRFQTFHSDRFWSCVHTVVHCTYVHTYSNNQKAAIALTTHPDEWAEPSHKRVVPALPHRHPNSPSPLVTPLRSPESF